MSYDSNLPRNEWWVTDAEMRERAERFTVVSWVGDDNSRWFDVVDGHVGAGGKLTRAGVVRTVNTYREARETADWLNNEAKCKYCSASILHGDCSRPDCKAKRERELYPVAAD